MLCSCLDENCQEMQIEKWNHFKLTVTSVNHIILLFNFLSNLVILFSTLYTRFAASLVVVVVFMFFSFLLLMFNSFLFFVSVFGCCCCCCFFVHFSFIAFSYVIIRVFYHEQAFPTFKDKIFFKNQIRVSR